MINIQKYVKAKSLEEAYELNQNKRSLIIAGMLWTRMGSRTVGTAIDISDLGLDQISENEDEFSIGAMVTLRQIEKHESLNAFTGGMAEKAVSSIVGVQFRNMATVGGSIWGRYGFSDVLTLFLALDSYVELYKGGIIPLEQFAAMKADRDILVRVIVKKTKSVIQYKSVRNQSTDFPVITCAVSCIDGQYKAVVGARPGRALLVPDAQGILADASPANSVEDAADAFASYVARQVKTGSNMRGSAQYRTHLIEVLTKRNIMDLMEAVSCMNSDAAAKPANTDNAAANHGGDL